MNMLWRNNVVVSRPLGAGAILDHAARAAWVILMAGGLFSPSSTEGSAWTLRFEPTYSTARGHDQHVLTIHEIDAGAQTDTRRAVHFETDGTIAFRGGIGYDSGAWQWGADFLWYSTPQGIPDLAASSPGAGQSVVFEVPDRSYTSTAPNEILYYRVLEDNDLIIYKVDVFAMRALSETPEGSFKLQLGITLADFDNDYHAAVGIEDVGGSQLDASSNYSWMPGPLVGVAGQMRLGESTLGARLGQAVVFGNPTLTTMTRDFTGPFSDTVTFTTEESFSSTQDVAIPITEFAITWTYRMTDHIALGAGANTTIWWDVSVPPGVIPGVGGDQPLHENTLTFFGLFAALEISF